MLLKNKQRNNNDDEDDDDDDDDDDDIALVFKQMPFCSVTSGSLSGNTYSVSWMVPTNTEVFLCGL